MTTMDERVADAMVPGGRTIGSDPYPWPFDGNLRPENTAIVVIDMQVDFCAPGGYVDSMGYDISLTRAPIGPIAKVLEAARAKGFHVIHTREGHKPDLSDLPANKRWRSQRIGARHRRPGPLRTHPRAREPGWRSSRNCSRLPAKRSSTSQARARSLPPISISCCRPRACATSSFAG